MDNARERENKFLQQVERLVMDDTILITHVWALLKFKLTIPEVEFVEVQLDPAPEYPDAPDITVTTVGHGTWYLTVDADWLGGD